ncbi:VirB3 family type IV secretion system protein [Asticcacaulis sp. EMRT-3]|uniref:type IV secretion system protein VirB3 n=1 Tax=Asticcacaulis sp. EMRT-3 TaxID=3040349 RepID=UPI0024AF26E9|nr:VirB3 family type IV secretion system protein [Asticcacaulis sp. EMRT-3]MDI7776577.1 VirB3 family type IV secretion system protein [Asticcacaulis sp. EMRT-3]
MDDFRDPIFKGCTRPAMFLGVPMMPFLMVTGVCLLAGGWLMYLISPVVSLFIGLTYVAIVAVMRQVTRKDDQRLHQLLMRARMRHRHGAARRRWDALSFAPLAYKKRKS